MEEILRTNDITEIALARAVLDEAGIECFEFDVNMSVLEGSIGVLPRRLMVRRADRFLAAAALREAGLTPTGQAR